MPNDVVGYSRPIGENEAGPRGNISRPHSFFGFLGRTHTALRVGGVVSTRHLELRPSGLALRASLQYDD
jgi:hypothetical protein